MSYDAKRQRHKADFGSVGLDKIRAPGVPPMLGLYFELQRWPGSLLWDGGLQDQPAWIWDLVDLAGAVYNDVVNSNEEAIGSPIGGP